ncbi:DoxX family protein [Streptomyces sp. NPDC085932]|uniref:DoxX family protein n=1 Tax=Streptomyces sp. NPDC085932 TaxID=3365741 RepID=UPI0037D16EB3
MERSNTPADSFLALTLRSLRTPDAGILIFRIIFGAIMVAHGTQKLFGWFNGGGIEGTSKFFSTVGYPASSAMAILAGLTETLGGMGIALGLFSAISGAAVLGTMANALWISIPNGYMSGPGGVGYDLPLVLCAGAFTLILTGPGMYSIDRLLRVGCIRSVNSPIWALIGLGVAVATLLSRG